VSDWPIHPGVKKSICELRPVDTAIESIVPKWNRQGPNWFTIAGALAALLGAREADDEPEPELAPALELEGAPEDPPVPDEGALDTEPAPDGAAPPGDPVLAAELRGVPEDPVLAPLDPGPPSGGTLLESGVEVTPQAALKTSSDRPTMRAKRKDKCMN
jgi:hypothetical protein